MSPDDLRAARKSLSCTAKELAETIGVMPAEVLAWEREEGFPTKRWVDKISALVAQGPNAIARKKKKATKTLSPMGALADAETWALIRKILGHNELRAECIKLAESYSDPIAAPE